MVTLSDALAFTDFGLDGDHNFVILLTAIGCFTAIVISLAGIISSCIDSVHRRKNEADLKRDMLDRGMSADEIAKVIAAAPPSDNLAARWIDGCLKK